MSSENPTRPPVNKVETAQDVIDKLNIPDDVGYGTGFIPGPPNEDVRRLQQYIRDNTEDATFTTFTYENEKGVIRGIDGRWGPETQAELDRYAKDLGVATVGRTPQQILADVKVKEGEKLTSPSTSTDQDTNNTEHFQEQCILISNIKNIIDIVSAVSEQDRSSIKYDNIHLVHTADPSTLMNKIKMTEGMDDLINIRHWELSSLTPTIRLYKQYYQEDSAEASEVEFQFNSFVDPIKDLQNMLNSQSQRGIGVGIKSFDWKFQGVNPATATKDIKATLKIKAASLNEIFTVRTAIDQNGKIIEDGYRIIDFVILEKKNILEENRNIRFNPKYFEIKAVVGWAASGRVNVADSDANLSDKAFTSGIFNKGGQSGLDRGTRLNDALRENQLTLILVAIDHSFEFQQDGSVDLTIEFVARSESILIDNDADILSDQNTRAMRVERRKLLDSIVAGQVAITPNTVPSGSGEIIQRLREVYRVNAQKEKQISYQPLISSLLQDDKVYTIETTVGQAAETNTNGNTSIESGGSMSFTLLPENNKKDPIPAGTRRISFVFLGDLISQAFNNVVLQRDDIGRDIKYKNLKLILGNIIFDNPSPEIDGSIDLNLANLPVSIELLNDFIRTKIVSKDFETYPFLIFIRDVIRSLITEVISKKCFGSTSNLSLILDTGQIIADGAEGGLDPLQVAIGGQSPKSSILDIDTFGPREGGASKYIFSSFNRKPFSEKYTYVVIYAFDKQPLKIEDTSLSLYDYDYSRGILHLTAGTDRGLVKSMTFNKTTQTYLREARFQDSDFKPELQLANVYNVSVEMFGNNLFYPGSQVYINPRGLGADSLGEPAVENSFSNIMGLGGYHTIITISNSISTNGFKTTLEALFSTSGDGKKTTKSKNQIAGDTVIQQIKYNDIVDMLGNSSEAVLQ